MKTNPPQISKPNPLNPSVAGNMLPVTQCCVGYGDISNEKASNLPDQAERKLGSNFESLQLFIYGDIHYVTLLNCFVNLC
jgi:hypothetical protein